MRDETSVRAALEASLVGEKVTLRGWVRTRRDSKGGFSFIEVNDGSCMFNLQLIADADLENYESEIKRLTAGCSISAKGLIKESGGKGQSTEMQVESLTVHGWSDPEEYPLQKSYSPTAKLRGSNLFTPRVSLSWCRAGGKSVKDETPETPGETPDETPGETPNETPDETLSETPSETPA